VQERNELKKSKMFGAPCVKTPNGKAAIMVWKNSVVFKLPDKALEKLLKEDGIDVFEPMKGRRMSGWAEVPAALEKKWEKLAKESIEYVSDLD
jgi:hypothetical protein